MAMAQSPESAQARLASCAARSARAWWTTCCPPEEMPAKLAGVRGVPAQPPASKRRGRASARRRASSSRASARLLRRQTGHDFSQLQDQTRCVRRIQRRMQVLQVPSVAGYVARLRQDPQGGRAALPRPADRRHALLPRPGGLRGPGARGDPAARSSARARKARCASGRRAAPPARRPTRSPSCCGRRWPQRDSPAAGSRSSPGDIDDEALEFARAGALPGGHRRAGHRRSGWSASSSSRTTATRSTKEIREMCIFSTHNLIKDPPFSRLDLIVCRNLLIYLEAELQQHVAHALPLRAAPGRLPVPRPRRRACGPAELFSHRRQEAPHLPAQRDGGASAGRASRCPTRPRPSARGQPTWALARAGARSSGSWWPALEQLLLDQYAPAWVIINAQGEARPLLAAHRQYLEPAAGAPERGRRRAWRARACAWSCAPPSTRPSRPGEAVVRENVTVRDQRRASSGSTSSCGRSPSWAPTRLLPGRLPGAGARRGRAQAAKAGALRPPGERRGPAARERAAQHQGPPAGDDRGGGDLERGAEVLQRGAALHQRGAAVGQRGAADLQGGAAVGQRGAGDDQRGAEQEGRGARRAPTATCRTCSRARRSPPCSSTASLRIKRFTRGGHAASSA